jgi:hypothetical protein
MPERWKIGRRQEGTKGLLFQKGEKSKGKRKINAEKAERKRKMDLLKHQTLV